MDRLGANCWAPRTTTPTGPGSAVRVPGAVPPRWACGTRATRRRPGARPLPRRRHRQRGVHAPVPRQPGGSAPVRRRGDRWLPQPDRCSATSGSSGPRAASPTTSRPASVPPCGTSWPRPRPMGFLIPQVVYGYFPANGDGNDLVVWTDESRSAERPGSCPRQTKAPYYCTPTSSAGGGDQVDYAAPIVTMGPAVSERIGQAVRGRPLPGLPPAARPGGRDGRGAGRVLAPAHAGGMGSPTRTACRSPACSASSTGAVATRGGTRPAPTRTT